MKNDFAKKCFVCENKIRDVKEKNKTTNLPVCNKCIGTKQEKLKEKEVLDTLADGFVCGCI